MKLKLLSRVIEVLPNFLWPLKLILMRKSIGKIGKTSRISVNSILSHPELIQIDDTVFIGPLFYCSAVVHIKNRVMFGAQCTLIGGNHKFDDPNICMAHYHEPGSIEPITIEEDAWIGNGTTILKGVTVGEGSIIGAESVVTKNVKPYSIYVGNPAKYIKPRFKNYDDLLVHLKMMKEKYNFKTKYSLDELKY